MSKILGMIAVLSAFSAVWTTLCGAEEIECIRYREYVRSVAATPTTGYAYGVAVAGPHTFVALGEAGLAIFELEGLGAASVPVGTLDTPGEARRLTVSEGRAYIAAKLGGLQIVDISNPAAPALISTLALPDEAWDVAVAGDHAYVADWYAGGLQVVDVSDPGAPHVVAWRTVAGYAKGIALKRDLAFLGVAGSGNQPKLVIYDVSNPAAPHQLALLRPGGDAGVTDVAVAGRYAYLACGPSGVKVVDFWYPAAAHIVGTVDTPGFADGIAVSENLVFVADGFESGLHVVDVSNPSAPTIAASSGSVDAWGVAVKDETAYLADGRYGLRLYDVSFPTGPPLAASINLPHIPGSIAVSGNHAYVTQGIETETGEVTGALQVVDISDLSSPALAGFVELPHAAYVEADGEIAYVTEGYEGGFFVVDVSSAEAPVARGSLATQGGSWEMVLNGHFAFVTSLGSGLKVVDVADPDAPALVATVDLPGLDADVALLGNHAFVSHLESPEVLSIVDLSDPASPSVMSSLVAEGEYWGIAARGGYVYLAGESPESEDFPDPTLLVVDARDPFHPLEVTRIPLPWSTGELEVDGKVMYCGGLFGMSVIDISLPAAPFVVGQASQHRYGTGLAVSPEAILCTRWTWPDPTGGYYFEVRPRQCPRAPGHPEIESLVEGPQLRGVPNPSHGDVVFEIEPAGSVELVLEIYDVRGRLVRRLAATGNASGSTTLRWDGHDEAGAAAPNGVYFARQAAGGGSAIERIVLLR